MAHAPEHPLTWSEGGQPRSALYGDVYFSAEDGLAEARAVFLQGCGLPQAWIGRRRFVVGELGFGTGLNMLALLDLWRRHRPPEGRLQVFSVEAHPLGRAEAARALAHWPELADLTNALLAQWPGRARGPHRLEFPELGAIVDVAVEEAGPALAGWSGKADAWFLDGFSPALNPAMWRDEVLMLVGARSAPGATVATFTVAGQVRRGLAAAGFAVEKQPGFGRKRERLAARLPGAAAPQTAPGAVAIIGAGIAGAAAARAVRSLGAQPMVFDRRGPGAGASGNAAALVTPRLDAGLGAPAALFAQAFRRAVGLYGQHGEAILAKGVLQLPAQARDARRFATLAASDLFEPGSLEPLDADQTTALMAEPAPPGLAQRTALVVAPAAILADWAADVRQDAVASIDRRDGSWALLDQDGRELIRADAVILAAGPGSAALAPDVELRPVRGQVTFVPGAQPPQAVAGAAYAAPAPGGMLFGATHDREDGEADVRSGDDARNLAALGAMAPRLAARLAEGPFHGRAAVRAATRDQIPLAGPVGEAPGLFVLAGLGSRGFSLAPLLGEHVAALALGAPSPLPGALAAVVDPGRFARRAARRGR